MSRSSTKFEYKALAATTTELLWLQSLLFELHITLPSTPLVLCDNLNAKHLCHNLIYHAHTKHIKLDHHFVHDSMIKGVLDIQNLPTSDQLVDLLTKALGTSHCLSLRNKLMVLPLPSI